MTVRLSALAFLLAGFLTLPAAAATATAAEAARANPATVRPAGVAWFDGEVEAAFALAKQQGKPVFMYWGASWCPPCNQVKATIFSRQDFIERSRLFIPVYVDGDLPSAQRYGTRFKVSGYPTMVLFRPDGTEVTRLPGEAEAAQYMQALTLGLRATRPVDQLLAAAQAGKPLGDNDWRMLALYSWETDDGRLLPAARVPVTLYQLSARAPAGSPEVGPRLLLKAVALAGAAKQTDAFDRADALRRVRAIVDDPVRARASFVELTGYAGSIVGALTTAGTPQRDALVRAWDARLVALAADPQLSMLDRLAASDARVTLATLDRKGPVSPELQAEVRAAAVRADRTRGDRYAREATIVSAAGLLADAGLLDESDALLTRELQRSATPHYYMSGLAANARERGDKAAAIDWAQRAWTTAQGPATRLQWGGSYVRSLIDLAPQDAARIEATARAVLAELEPAPSTFMGRNEAVLKRLGTRLADWNKDGSQDAVLARLRTQLDATCAKLPAGAPERAACSAVFAQKAAGQAAARG